MLGWLRNGSSASRLRSVRRIAGGSLRRAHLRSRHRAPATVAEGAGAPVDVTRRPHVHELALHLAERAGIERVVAIGSGRSETLVRFADRWELAVVDRPDGLARLDERLAGADRVEADLEQGLPAALREFDDRTLVVCADAIEHLDDPRPLVRGLADAAARASYVLVSASDRARVPGTGDVPSPAEPGRRGGSSLDELVELLRGEGVAEPILAGYTVDTDHDRAKSTALVLAGRQIAVVRRPPVRVAAVMNVHNEVDILPEVLRHLTGQGVDVHVVDNWSTDGSYELVGDLAARDERVTVERFPDAPSPHHELALLLRHGQEWAATAGYDWIIHHDADELRYSPWPGVTLAEAITFVDSLGYNAIDFSVLDFRFLEDRPDPEPPFEKSIRFFEFGGRPGHFLQIKGWRQPPGEPVDLASTGGHEAAFPGRSVFPLKFLMKHYSLRSREQANRKIRERIPRTERARTERGWHTHYVRFRDTPITGWSTSGLTPWHEPTFWAEFLVERLSGIGISRESQSPASPDGS